MCTYYNIAGKQEGKNSFRDVFIRVVHFARRFSRISFLFFHFCVFFVCLGTVSRDKFSVLCSSESHQKVLHLPTLVFIIAIIRLLAIMEHKNLFFFVISSILLLAWLNVECVLFLATCVHDIVRSLHRNKVDQHLFVEYLFPFLVLSSALLAFYSSMQASRRIGWWRESKN